MNPKKEWHKQVIMNSHKPLGCGICFCPSKFALGVDEFGIKYEGLENAQHITNEIKKYYEVYVNWLGSRYCVIQVKI